MIDPTQESKPSDEVGQATGRELVSGPCTAVEAASALRISSEEQLARFEEALKEEDWGHQPC
ncbi:MAG: hypothetical protein JNK85_28505 [Verrucomicrobiales bacterium]|nr:hypothetical protein [Verrucomicrobiales bacterium]